MARIVRTTVPEKQYARNGDTHLVYQTLGEGPPDIVWGLGTPGTHVEQMWEEPTSARSLRRIAAMGRLIIFDPRGSGLSDPVSPREVPTVDERADDICAVLDAVGSQRAVVVGFLALRQPGDHGGRLRLAAWDS